MVILTRRERDILEYFISGWTGKEIAREWGTNSTVVSRHAKRLKLKLNARTNLQAISRAYELGILQIERDEP